MCVRANVSYVTESEEIDVERDRGKIFFALNG
jgi:hypothetical protein